MDFISSWFIWTWFTEDPWTRIPLVLSIANTIAQKTPWKGDDDIIAIIGDIFKTILTGRSSK